MKYYFNELFTNNFIKLTPKNETTLKLNEIVTINNLRYKVIDIK